MVGLDLILYFIMITIGFFAFGFVALTIWKPTFLDDYLEAEERRKMRVRSRRHD